MTPCPHLEGQRAHGALVHGVAARVAGALQVVVVVRGGRRQRVALHHDDVLLGVGAARARAAHHDEHVDLLRQLVQSESKHVCESRCLLLHIQAHTLHGWDKRSFILPLSLVLAHICRSLAIIMGSEKPKHLTHFACFLLPSY